MFTGRPKPHRNPLVWFVLISPAVLASAAASSDPRLYPASQGDKFGYIDRSGKFVIAPQFDMAGPFSEALAPVVLDAKAGYIDQTGKLVIKPQFDWGWRFFGGLASVRIGRKWGCINRSGEVVIPVRHEYVGPFLESIAPVKRGKKWGYLDKAGKLAIRAQFESAGPFSEGLAPVQVEGKWGYIDPAEKFVIEPRFVLAMRFSEGLATVMTARSQWGYIDKSGEFVISAQFDAGLPFVEGLAPVQVTGKGWGYIDKTGATAILPQFDRASRFHAGLAEVKIAGRPCYIDKSGSLVWAHGADESPEVAPTQAPAAEEELVRLPAALSGIFMVPDADKDQHGKWVVRRSAGGIAFESLIGPAAPAARSRVGSTSDAKSGLPYEIWLKEPRMEFVLLTPGVFRMGSPPQEPGRDQDEGPLHAVRIARPHYLGKYEVTRHQWKQVMGTEPWQAGGAHAGSTSAPADLLCWHDCERFLKKLSREAARFSLPTEAQWEYACRAGTDTQFPYGHDPRYVRLRDHAWFSDNSWVMGRVHVNSVGRRKPNRWGFYDLLGGVWEWCNDWYGPGYYQPKGVSRDPRGPREGRRRVLRGGSRLCDPKYCRSAGRHSNHPAARAESYGFRVCLEVLAADQRNQ